MTCPTVSSSMGWSSSSIFWRAMDPAFSLLVIHKVPMGGFVGMMSKRTDWLLLPVGGLAGGRAKYIRQWKKFCSLGPELVLVDPHAVTVTERTWRVFSGGVEKLLDT